MWTVVFITETKFSADKMIQALKDGGILASARSSVPGSEDGMIEILVPECEAEEAQEVIRARQMRLPVVRG